MTETLPQFTAAYSVAASADDAYVSVVGSSINTTGTYVVMGGTLYEQTYHAGVRFNPVSLPAGANLVQAELRLTANADASTTPTFYVYAETADEAQPYSTYADLMGRALTSVSVTWQGKPARRIAWM